MNDSTENKYRFAGLKNSGVYRRYTTHEDILQAASTNQEYPTDNPHGTYGALLFKPEWRAKRAEILQRDNHTCSICYGSEDLQVHHRQYHFIASLNQFKLPWDYPDYLLITLCESCHKRGHSKFKVPTISI